MNIEIPQRPEDLALWMEDNGYVAQEVKPGVWEVRQCGTLLATTGNDSDAITFCLGRFILQQLANIK